MSAACAALSATNFCCSAVSRWNSDCEVSNIVVDICTRDWKSLIDELWVRMASGSRLVCFWYWSLTISATWCFCAAISLSPVVTAAVAAVRAVCCCRSVAAAARSALVAVTTARLVRARPAWARLSDAWARCRATTAVVSPVDDSSRSFRVWLSCAASCFF